MECKQEYIDFANQLAEISGGVLRQYYRNNSDVNIKSDLSPVTAADRQVEMSIRSKIERHYPEHGILGEEFSPSREDADYKWIIDPIDGTISFIVGRPLFGTLIALTYKDVPILGVIDQPITQERWIGAIGHAATFNGQTIKSRDCKKLKHATLCTTALHYFSKKEAQQYLLLADKVSYPVYGGDCYNYGLLALGTVDIVMESGLKPHDFCALAPIVNASGGVMTDWKGNPLTLHSKGQVLAVGDKTLQQSILVELVEMAI